MIRCRLLIVGIIAITCACAGGATEGNDSGTAPDAGSGQGAEGWPPLPDSGQAAEPTATEQATFEQLVELAKSQIVRDGVPGAAVGVLLQGKKPMLRGIGVKRKGAEEQVTADTLFSLASVSKVFTAATIMALAEKGTLHVDDKVTEHLPGLKTSHPALAGQMTIAQLLQHTSGLGYPSEQALDNAPVDWSAPDYQIQLFEKVTWPIWSPPGEVWNYSNCGYSLAGVMIERATRRSFAEEVRDRILKPAGMSNSTASATEVTTRDHAYGHDASGRSIQPGLDISIPFDDPANGVYSSAREMITFLRQLIGGSSALSAASVQAMTRRQVPFPFYSGEEGYGYGIFVRQRGNVVVLSHSGGNVGFTSQFVVVPAKGFAVIVLMNSELGDPYSVAEKALDLFLELPVQPFMGQPSTAAELQPLTGTYTDPFDLGEITVALNGGQLQATFAKWDHVTPLVQLDKRYFSFATSAKMSQDLYAGPEIYAAIYVDGAGKGEYIVSLWGVAARTTLSPEP